jgi:pimeloyl-ACP methyl ester carboxylesterase
MPLVLKGGLTVDYAEQGHGEPVVLVHSSVSGNRQWRALGDALADRYRVLAINLFGYGETTAWPGNTSQSLYAQASLILALPGIAEGPLHLVGHSFGASVALKAALLLGRQVRKLVLIEPNPFSMLRQEGRMDAFLESRTLRDHVKCFGSLGDWDKVGERFADYWLGDGAWAAMPEKRRAAFAAALQPNFHEWDAVMSEETTLEQWRSVAAHTLVLSDPQTRRPIREIVEIFSAACPDWTFQALAGAGHMAALTRPELVNPLVRQFLDARPS